ncbi:MAG: D-alanyl-D-alanine carboxypeptidase family protein [Eubacteriales bacterium]|nr:D-alanyl-D-alanine carboxypeptidase family protein [Eubacteriales bacterium]
MKRFFTFLLALSLLVSTSSSFFTLQAQASQDTSTATEQAAEKTTEVNLTDDTQNSTNFTNLPDTGSSYGLPEYTDGPDIVAVSAVLMDARSGAVLYAKEGEQKRYPASITKIMTTLLTIENCKMDDIVTFSEKAVYGVEGSSANIPVGAQLTVEETLYALMLESANEAGAALAEHIAGGDEAFGQMMTARAQALGCTGTQFKNPHGLPNEEHYTTAHDMGRILQECIKHEEFRKISSTIHYTIPSNDTHNEIELTNHAKLLRADYGDYYYEYAVGAKTGFTQVARNTLVSFAERDGVQLLCVVMKDQGPENTYLDTKKLYNWGFDKVKTVNPLKSFDLNETLTSDESFTSKDVETWLSLNPEFNPDFPILIDKNFDEKNFKTSFRLDEEAKNGRLGFIDIKVDKETFYSVPVTYDKNSEAGKNYTAKSGGDDNLKTGTEKKSSVIKKAGIFLLRFVIACALIFIIMQIIRKRQLEKQRLERIKARQQKQRREAQRGNAPKKTSSSSSSSSQRRNSSSSQRRSSSSQNRRGNNDRRR